MLLSDFSVILGDIECQKTEHVTKTDNIERGAGYDIKNEPASIQQTEQ
ncbi:hypothetical protein STFR1_10337 [Bacillus vallismortis]